MSFRKCSEPCDRFITAGDTHDRCVLCLGHNHAQAVLSGLSNCLYCDSLRLKVLRLRLTAFSTGQVSNPRHSVSAVAEAQHETVAWGDALEFESMESETTEYSPFLTLSPGRAQELEERFVEPVVFADDDLEPALEAHSAVSFGCSPYDDDVLSTAASDSEDFMADFCSSLPPSRQEKRNSPSYVKLAVDKLGLEWDCEPTQNQAQSKLGFSLVVLHPSPVGLSPSFKTSTMKFRSLGSSHFWCELLTQPPQISPPFRWVCFKPIKQNSSKNWMKGKASPLRLLKNSGDLWICAESYQTHSSSSGVVHGRFGVC